MSTVVQDAALALESALKTVEGLRVYRLSDNVDPPAFVVGAPALRWDNFCGDPTEATFAVFLIETGDDRALERLWQHVGPASEAIDTVENAAVISAAPAIFEAGATPLPCYVLSVEVSL